MPSLTTLLLDGQKSKKKTINFDKMKASMRKKTFGKVCRERKLRLVISDRNCTQINRITKDFIFSIHEWFLQAHFTNIQICSL